MPPAGTTGYRKRRQRSTHQAHVYHQLHPAHVQHSHPRPPQQLREDIHDEMDILSVKQEVSKKFVLNHTLLENVTSKVFAVDSIKPPKPFPEAVIQGVKYNSGADEKDSNNIELMEREELILKSKLSNLLPNDVTFGDLKLMKLKLKMLEEDVDALEKEQDSGFNFGEEYEYQVKMTEKLTKSFGELNDHGDYKENERVVEEIITQNYNGEKFNKEIKEVPTLRQFSQPNLLPNRITSASVEEEGKLQLELESQQQQQQQQSIHGTPHQDPIYPAQPQQPQPPPMMPMATQNSPYDMYPPQPPYASATAASILPNQPLPPPTFLSAQQSPVQLSPQMQQQQPPLLSLPPPQVQQPAPPVQQQQQPQIPQALPQQQQSFQNPQLDTFGMFPSTDKDLFGENPADEILIDDGAFNGLQSTLEDQIFFDHSME